MVRLLFLKEKESYRLFYNVLGFMPHDLKPYRMALTHSSQTSSGAKKLHSNERLEFLGDAVLSSVVADYLYSAYRREREGFLSKSRSKIVCRDRLNTLAVELGLDKLLVTHDIGIQHNCYICGNALEALIGAIYIDRGYEYCRMFFNDKMFPLIGDINAVLRTEHNFKSRMIEWAQKTHRQVDFQLLNEEMRSDGVYFVSRICIDGEPYGIGEGFSKRESQQKAAREALEKLAVTASKIV